MYIGNDTLYAKPDALYQCSDSLLSSWDKALQEAISTVSENSVEERILF